MTKWIESSLDQYRNELYTVTYPIFVHCYLDLVAREYTEEAKKFIEDHCVEHEQYHVLEIRELAGVTTPEQMASSDLVFGLANQKVHAAALLVLARAVLGVLDGAQVYGVAWDCQPAH